MNIHKNARFTFARRLEMVQGVLERKLAPTAAAAMKQRADRTHLSHCSENQTRV